MQKKSEKIIFTLYLLGFLALALKLRDQISRMFIRRCMVIRRMNMRDI